MTRIILVKNKEITRFDKWCKKNNQKVVRLVLAKNEKRAAKRQNLVGYYYYIEDMTDSDIVKDTKMLVGK